MFPNALGGNRTPGGSNLKGSMYGNDPGYHYPINAITVTVKRLLS